MRNVSLELTGQLGLLTSGSEVGVDQVRRATQLILARGVTEAQIELYTDRFSDAAMEGRLPAATREAYVEGLLELVDALPAASMPAVAVRTQRALSEELDQLERTISGYEVEIRELDRQIAETNARVTQKLQRARELSDRREALLRQIETANRQKQAVFVFAAIIGVATMGLGAPAAGAIGGGAAMAIGIADAQRQIDRVRSELTAVDGESASLRSLAQAFDAQRQAFEANVTALRAEEAALRAAIAKAPVEGESLPVTLAVDLIVSRTLANNLQQQIRVLRAQLKGAREVEQQLDGMIQKLETEVSTLEKRAEQAQRELLEAILTTVIALAGVRSNLRAGPFSISKAKLLTRGVDFLRTTLRDQVAKLLENAVVQGVLQATGSQLAARALLQAIDVFGDGTIDGKAANAAGLTGPQHYLMDLIVRTQADIDRAAEEEAVLRRGDLTDEQARREAKRLVKSLRPAASLLPVGDEVAAWREARDLVLDAERILIERPEDVATVRALVADAQAKLRPGTPAHRALGLYLTGGFGNAGLYAALAILSLDR